MLTNIDAKKDWLISSDFRIYLILLKVFSAKNVPPFGTVMKKFEFNIYDVRFITDLNSFNNLLTKNPIRSATAAASTMCVISREKLRCYRFGDMLAQMDHQWRIPFGADEMLIVILSFVYGKLNRKIREQANGKKWCEILLPIAITFSQC